MRAVLVATELQSDVYKLMQTYISNFVDPTLLKACDNITTVDFKDERNELSHNKLVICRIFNEAFFMW